MALSGVTTGAAAASDAAPATGPLGRAEGRSAPVGGGVAGRAAAALAGELMGTASGAGGVSSSDTVVQALRVPTIHIHQTRRPFRRSATHPSAMTLLLLEALGALLIFIFIVWWTMFSGRKKGELPEEAEREKTDKNAATGPKAPPKPD
jgi:hypothetical protein